MNNIDYSKKLIEIIDKDAYSERFAIDGGMLIAISLINIKKMAVYLYGAVADIASYVKFFKEQGCNIVGIIDADCKKTNKLIDGVRIILPGELDPEEERFVFICTAFFQGMEQVSILKNIKYGEKTIYYALNAQDRIVITTKTENWIDAERAAYYKDNQEMLIRLVNWLDDQESKETLCEYIRSYIELDVYKLPQCQTRYKYFYGKDKELIYKHKEDEIWLNCGASCGDTIFSFYGQNLSAKRVYAYEGDKRAYIRLMDSLTLLPDELKANIYIKNEFVGEDTFIGEDERYTFINADIEGAEYKLLQSCKEIIRRDKPVLAISVYHKKEDLIVIPEYIKKLDADYSFVLRKYTAWEKNINRNHELVLYAIPQSRRI